MKIGICGLPNVGKSLFFNVLTGLKADTNIYPFTTIDPNFGEVEVPDKNLDFLSSVFKDKKITNARIKIVDVAGLVKGSNKGEGLGNQFLSHLRNMELLLYVLRNFSSSNISSYLDEVSPIKEKEILDLEFALSDIDILERRREKLIPVARTGSNEAKIEIDKINAHIERLQQGKGLDEDVEGTLSGKKKVYLLNTDETNFERASEFSYKPKLVINVKLEDELKSLSKKEQKEYRDAFFPFDTIEDLIITLYKELDFITFYTIKGEEIRAWNIKRGTNIKKAAGKIHSSFEEGFIKAKVVKLSDLKKTPEWKNLEENGKVKIAGSDYIVEDKDVVEIMFKSS